MHLNESNKTDLKNLLIVVISSVVCAILLAGTMLYYYGPTGHYFARDLLLAPALTRNLSYEEPNGLKSQRQRYLFDSFDFAYYDSHKKSWIHSSINDKAYQNFYEAVSSDSSLADFSHEIELFFTRGDAATLSIKVKADSAASSETKSFQDVLFAYEGDYFRVRLRNETPDKENWAYFYHPGIYQEVMKIFVNR